MPFLFVTGSPCDKGNNTVAAFRGGGGGGGGGGGATGTGVGSVLATVVTKGLESEVRGIAGKAIGTDALVLLDSSTTDIEEAADNLVTLKAVELSESKLTSSSVPGKNLWRD